MSILHKALERTASFTLAHGFTAQSAAALRALLRAKGRTDLEVRVCREAAMQPELYAKRAPYVHEFRDVLLDTGYWVVISGTRAFVRETYDRNFTKSALVGNRYQAQRMEYVLLLPPASIEISEPSVLLGGDENYSHWVLRSLLRLSLVDTDPRLRGLPLVVPDELTGYQREYLELLAIPEARLLRVQRERIAHCTQLHVPTQMRGNSGFAAAVAWFKSRLGLNEGARGADAKLLVSRRDSPNRALLNEDEIFAVLQPLGFRRLEAGRMSVREQLEAFSGAAVIVGAHGAGLTNMIFAPRGALVVELTSTLMHHMADFRWIAPMLGQKIRTIVSDDFGEAGEAPANPVNRPFRVDPQAVLAALR